MQTEQQIRDEFKKVFIEKFHNLPYEEAIKKEFLKGKSSEVIQELGQYAMLEDWMSKLDSQMTQAFCEGVNIATSFKVQTITIGRVIQAIENNIKDELPELDEYGEPTIDWRNRHPSYSIDKHYYSTGVSELISGVEYTKIKAIQIWEKLTKENLEECTDDDQDIETIKKLLDLLKQNTVS